MFKKDRLHGYQLYLQIKVISDCESLFPLTSKRRLNNNTLNLLYKYYDMTT